MPKAVIVSNGRFCNSPHFNVKKCNVTSGNGNLLWLSLPVDKLDPNGPIREEQRVVDLVHALADRVLEAVPAEESGKQHVQVLLGEPKSNINEALLRL